MISQNEKNLIYRVLDANFNRAVEGLRAVEEYFRFVVENHSITALLKQLRHDICSICKDWTNIWVSQRDSESDVGSLISANDEYHRPEIKDLLEANLSRVNQALRAMEEYSKTLGAEIAPQVEAVRYRFYELEKVVKRSLTACSSLSQKTIYVLTSACQSMEDFESRIDLLCDSGADLIQLREKNLSDGELLKRAKAAVKICKMYPTLFVVNDRPDIALMSAADGVHVGQEEFPVTDLRRILRNDMLIGVSTHSLEQALEAEKNGADYIGVGPTFASQTKCFTEFKGPELLREVAAQVSIPAFAIGGINLDNIAQIREAGIKRVAVSGAVNKASSPRETIRTLRAGLQ